MELTGEEQEKLAALAKHQSLAQLLGDALGQCPEAAEIPVTKELVRESMLALRSTLKLEQEKRRICQVLDEAHIPYISLKGARIRPYYPKPWMRTSCDNDILVHDEDVDRAAALLADRLGYSQGTRTYHDISLFSKSGIHLELHFSIKENKPAMDAVLAQVWEYSAPKPGSGNYEYQQSNEFFLFHLIAHMAQHFMEGGCGIRPFIDLFLLQEQLSYKEEQVENFCRTAGLAQFYSNCNLLVDVWFRDRSHSPVTQRMEDYLLSGGTYGTRENQIAVKETQSDNKFGYILHQIFTSSEHLCERYPSLRKHKWMMPLYQVRRWYTALHRGKLNELKTDFQLAQSLDKKTVSAVEHVLRDSDMI